MQNIITFPFKKWEKIYLVALKFVKTCGKGWIIKSLLSADKFHPKNNDFLTKILDFEFTIIYHKYKKTNEEK